MFKNKDSLIDNLGILTRQHGHVVTSLRLLGRLRANPTVNCSLFRATYTCGANELRGYNKAQNIKVIQINTIGGTDLGFSRSLGLSTICPPHQFLSGPSFLPFSLLEFSCKPHKCRENAELS